MASNVRPDDEHGTAFSFIVITGEFAMSDKPSSLDGLAKFYEDSFRFSISLSIVNKSIGQSWRETVTHPAASLAKLFVIGTVAELLAAGTLDFEQRLAMHRFVPGSGVVKYLGEPLSLKISELAYLAVVYSDNSATNRLLDEVGFDAVNDFIQRAGCLSTRLTASFMAPASSTPTSFNVTTAHDVIIFYRGVMDGFPAEVHRGTPAICRRIFASSSGSLIDTLRFLLSGMNLHCMSRILLTKPKTVVHYLRAVWYSGRLHRLTSFVSTAMIVARKSGTGNSVFHDSCVLQSQGKTLYAVAMIEGQAACFQDKQSEAYAAAERFCSEVSMFLRSQ